MGQIPSQIHPNIIRYYDATIISSVNAIGEEEKIQVGIMEYANAGDITDLFSSSDRELKMKIIKDILRGLVFLHDNKLAHRDLKPKNILMHRANEEMHAKIADFGISLNTSYISSFNKLMIA